MSGRAAAWIALLAPGSLWLALLLAAYAVVPWTCHGERRGLLLWALIALALVLTLGALPLARRAHAGAAASNAYGFLARAAQWLTLAFAVVIVVTAIPLAVLPRCH